MTYPTKSVEHPFALLYVTKFRQVSSSPTRANLEELVLHHQPIPYDERSHDQTHQKDTSDQFRCPSHSRYISPPSTLSQSRTHLRNASVRKRSLPRPQLTADSEGGPLNHGDSEEFDITAINRPRRASVSCTSMLSERREGRPPVPFGKDVVVGSRLKWLANAAGAAMRTIKGKESLTSNPSAVPRSWHGDATGTEIADVSPGCEGGLWTPTSLPADREARTRAVSEVESPDPFQTPIPRKSPGNLAIVQHHQKSPEISFSAPAGVPTWKSTPPPPPPPRRGSLISIHGEGLFFLCFSSCAAPRTPKQTGSARDSLPPPFAIGPYVFGATRLSILTFGTRKLNIVKVGLGEDGVVPDDGNMARNTGGTMDLNRGYESDAAGNSGHKNSDLDCSPHGRARMRRRYPIVRRIPKRQVVEADLRSCLPAALPHYAALSRGAMSRPNLGTAGTLASAARHSPSDKPIFRLERENQVVLLPMEHGIYYDLEKHMFMNQPPTPEALINLTRNALMVLQDYDPQLLWIEDEALRTSVSYYIINHNAGFFNDGEDDEGFLKLLVGLRRYSDKLILMDSTTFHDDVGSFNDPRTKAQILFGILCRVLAPGFTMAPFLKRNALMAVTPDESRPRRSSMFNSATLPMRTVGDTTANRGLAPSVLVPVMGDAWDAGNKLPISMPSVAVGHLTTYSYEQESQESVDEEDIDLSDGDAISAPQGRDSVSPINETGLLETVIMAGTSVASPAATPRVRRRSRQLLTDGDLGGGDPSNRSSWPHLMVAQSDEEVDAIPRLPHSPRLKRRVANTPRGPRQEPEGAKMIDSSFSQDFFDPLLKRSPLHTPSMVNRFRSPSNASRLTVLTADPLMSSDSEADPDSDNLHRKHCFDASADAHHDATKCSSPPNCNGLKQRRSASSITVSTPPPPVQPSAHKLDDLTPTTGPGSNQRYPETMSNCTEVQTGPAFQQSSFC